MLFFCNLNCPILYLDHEINKLLSENMIVHFLLINEYSIKLKSAPLTFKSAYMV